MFSKLEPVSVIFPNKNDCSVKVLLQKILFILKLADYESLTKHAIDAQMSFYIMSIDEARNKGDNQDTNGEQKFA